MPKSKPATTPSHEIDLSSSDEVLFHTGGPIYGNAPARHLTAGDLAYLHRVNALFESGGDPVKPATPAALAKLAQELVASGAFTFVIPRETIVDPVTESPDGPVNAEEIPE
jgi:hypothetical protein